MTFSNVLRISLVTAILGGLLLAALVNPTVNLASLSQYSASGFSQYCSQNPSICNKVNFNDARVGSVSCPSGNQVITNIFVHAGDGQKVWELPDSKFSYVLSNNGNTVTVTALPGTHDISWIAVVCTGSTPSGSPRTSPSSSPSPSASPSTSPSLSPSPSGQASSEPSPSPSTQASSEPSSEPSPSPSEPGRGGDESPTPTPTDSPTPTPTDAPDDPGDPGEDTDPGIGGSVLGTSTLAPTGNFVSNAIMSLGALLMGHSALNGKKKNRKAKKS